ncbi:MAG TPA: exodeoxyribonuclease V subunit alpha, partial [Rhodanobacteraceae bacterium]
VIPRDASTLHRLLHLSPSSARAKFHRDAPLPFDVVVVDEVSMVDLPMMAKLADAVNPDATLILLGDPEQLSAVEAGDVLGALVEAARGAPLSDCHVHLTQSHRFAKDSPLRRLAGAIVDGDADAALAVLQTGNGNRLVDDARQAALIEHAVEAYRAVLDATDVARALREAGRFRVLTALRHGPAGSLALDRAIGQRLKRHAAVRSDASWWPGRLLMITANRAELGLFNGDVGVVWPDADGVPKAWFEGADGAARAISPAALPPHEGAFALTVHKAQGSEFDRVALVLGADTPVLTRELLYTGVTRARSGLNIYGDAALLRAGIARRAQRWNGLADRLREAAAAPSSIAESLPAAV